LMCSMKSSARMPRELTFTRPNAGAECTGNTTVNRTAANGKGMPDVSPMYPDSEKPTKQGEMP